MKNLQLVGLLRVSRIVIQNYNTNFKVYYFPNQNKMLNIQPAFKVNNWVVNQVMADKSNKNMF